MRTTRRNNYRIYDNQISDKSSIRLKCRECKNYLKCKEEEKTPVVGYGCFQKKPL